MVFRSDSPSEEPDRVRPSMIPNPTPMMTDQAAVAAPKVSIIPRKMIWLSVNLTPKKWIGKLVSEAKKKTDKAMGTNTP